MQKSKQTRCVLICLIAARLHGALALRLLLSATVLEVSYFNNFANGSERKGLSAFTGRVSFIDCRSTFSLEHKLSQKKNSRLARHRLWWNVSM